MTDSLILVTEGVVLGFMISFIGYCVFRMIQSEIQRREECLELRIMEKIHYDVFNLYKLTQTVVDLKNRIEILEGKK